MDMRDVLNFIKGEVEKQDKDFTKDGPGKEKVEEKTVDKEIIEENKETVEKVVDNNEDQKEVEDNQEKEDKKVEEKEVKEDDKVEEKEEEKESVSEVDSYKEEIARLKAELEKDKVEKVAKEYNLSVEEVDAFSGLSLIHI